MDHFIFMKTDGHDLNVMRKEKFQAVMLKDLIERFQMFLDSCGYKIDGKLGIIPDED